MKTHTNPLTGLKFRGGSASPLKKAARRGQTTEFQQAMTKQHRTARKRLEKSISSGESSILWSAEELASSPADHKLKRLLRGTGRERRAARSSAAEALTAGEFRPLVILTGIDTLVRHGRDMNKSDYAALYTALSHVEEISPDSNAGDEHQQLIQTLICDGELPLLLSLVLGDLQGQTARFKVAVKVLRQGLDAGTDSDGMLHATLISSADTWLAPLVRSSHWGSAFRRTWLRSKDTHRLADTVRACTTLLVQTGLVSRPPRELSNVDRSAADIVEHGIRAVGIRESSPFASLVRSHLQGKRRRSSAKKRKRQLTTSNQSDWAESAIMRSGLQIDSDVCIVNWDRPEPSIHLAVLSTPLLSGVWSSELTVDDDIMGPIEGWKCSCWFSDEEAAFVELEADPSDSVHVVRHVMLALRDRIGVVCESVTTDHAESTVRLKNQLPLASSPLAVTNSITREIAVHADCVSTRVIPAWLEDDKVQHTVGRCETTDGMLLAETEGLGGATMPLILDWHPERQALDADWNRLTVTEARTVLHDRNAAGFRVRIGKQQLLIYRSLRAGDGPRAVMGLHTMNETVYGRVRKSGEVAPLVLVESD
ncbi:MAG: hypothetical protein MK102_02485 [Fuerstiella sp.]|nr:hypothetical protein [Fuerstiella sp.]